jgi:hypothetical protein
MLYYSSHSDQELHKDTVMSVCRFDLHKNDTENLHIFRKWLPALNNVHYKMCRLRHDLLNYHKQHEGKKLVI